MEKISITDNFLAKDQFVALRDELLSDNFPWYYTPVIALSDTDKQTCPGFFFHMIHEQCAPCSPWWDSHFRLLMDQLDCVVVSHIRINLNTRLEESYSASFHYDTDDMRKDIAKQLTTSILYMNTNNGYTEFKQSDTKIESVANRLITFPSTTTHRVVTQTDEQRRILINFNYLK